MPVYQEEVDVIVARVRALVTKYGGQSPKIAKVREAYGFFRAAPGDPGGLALLMTEVERAEKEAR